MIKEGIWISGEVYRRDIKSLVKGRWEDEKFIPPRNLKGKDIVISICMDYFNNPARFGTLDDALNELIDFIISHSEDIKLITIAYSKTWCSYVGPEKVAIEICNRINALIVSAKDIKRQAGAERAAHIINDACVLKQGVAELRRTPDIETVSETIRKQGSAQRSL